MAMLAYFRVNMVLAILAAVTLPFFTRAEDEELFSFQDFEDFSYNFDPQCYRCYNNAEPDPEVPQNVTLFLTSSGAPVTCNDWADFMARMERADLTNGRCLGYQFLTAYHCGCPEPPRPNCMLCPDGSEPDNLDGVVVTPDGENTCRAYVIFAVRQSFGETVDSGREIGCKNLQETGVGTCGCPIPATDCTTLCPNGESVPEPDLVIFNDGLSCGEMERRLSVYDGGKCEAFQRTTGLSCGCEVDLSREFEEDLLQDIGLCRVCGDGRPLLDPAALTESNGREFTCAQVEVAATRDPGRTCGVARGFQYEDCCQEYFPSESPSASPSNAPSSQPSNAPSSQPSNAPSSQPSNPSIQPSNAPSIQPSSQPSSDSTQPPTLSPVEPTAAPVAPSPPANQSTTSDAGAIPVTSVFRIMLLIVLSMQLSWWMSRR